MVKGYLAAVLGLVVIIVAGVSNLQGATYGGGSGTEADPYQIWTPEQMNTIGANSGDWSKHFKLMGDINMSIYTGTQYRIIGNSTTKFIGTFDGNGHFISNLTYTTTATTNYIGLFGYILNATIQNLGLENVSISSGGDYIGGMVGYNSSGTIIDCYVNGSVNGKGNIGGLLGMSVGTINGCYTTSLLTEQAMGLVD
jgi:hypothetical protein